MKALMAAFDSAAGLAEAVRAARRERFTVADAFSPYPLEGIALDLPAAGALGWAAAGGGLVAAAAMFALEAWSAGAAYPFDTGGRPAFSWPVFLIAPFEIGVLAAALCGFVAFLVGAGLPRLHHPAFDIDGFERASQDRFLLALAHPRGDERLEALRALLTRAGALDLREVEL
jgi:hypothetical protein